MSHSRFSTLAIVGLALAACAAQAPIEPSITAAWSSSDTPPLVSSMMGYLREQLPPAASILQILPPTGSTSDTLTPALRTALTQEGYGLVSSTAIDPTAHTISYLIAPLDDGFLLRMTVDQSSIASFYTHDEQGHLTQRSPFTVMEPSQ